MPELGHVGIILFMSFNPFMQFSLRNYQCTSPSFRERETEGRHPSVPKLKKMQVVQSQAAVHQRRFDPFIPLLVEYSWCLVHSCLLCFCEPCHQR